MAINLASKYSDQTAEAYSPVRPSSRAKPRRWATPTGGNAQGLSTRSRWREVDYEYVTAGLGQPWRCVTEMQTWCRNRP